VFDQHALAKLFLTRAISKRTTQAAKVAVTVPPEPSGPAVLSAPPSPSPSSVLLSSSRAQGYVLESKDHGGGGAVGSPSVDPLVDMKELKASGMQDTEIDEWRAMFELCDADRDGSVSAKDLAERMALQGVLDVDAQALTSFLDANWSGSVEFVEFAKGAHDLRVSAGVNLARFLSAVSPSSSSSSPEDDSVSIAEVKALQKAIGGKLLLSSPSSSPMKRGTTPEARTPLAGLSKEEEDRLRDEIDRLGVEKKVAEDQLEEAHSQLAHAATERESLKRQLLEASRQQKATAESLSQAERQAKEASDQAEQLKERLRDATRLNQELRAQNRELMDRDAAARAVEESAAKQQAGDAVRQSLEKIAKEKSERTLLEL
jgi:hypothetical protein